MPIGLNYWEEELKTQTSPSRVHPIGGLDSLHDQSQCVLLARADLGKQSRSHHKSRKVSCGEIFSYEQRSRQIVRMFYHKCDTEDNNQEELVVDGHQVQE